MSNGTDEKAGGSNAGLASHDLKPEDLWFSRNLEYLLGGEIALVKIGNRDRIDREMLAEWIIKHL